MAPNPIRRLPARQHAILVVDDDEVQHELVRRTLERSGWSVVAARHGLDGLRAFRAGQFDLVITDIMMADMDGLSLTRSLVAERPDVKILALSGLKGREDLISAAREAGAKAALEKPISSRTLVATVRLMLAS